MRFRASRLRSPPIRPCSQSDGVGESSGVQPDNCHHPRESRDSAWLAQPAPVVDDHPSSPLLSTHHTEPSRGLRAAGGLMSKSSPVGFFTGVSPDRYRLPHRRLGLPVILLIRRVLCTAFEVLREQGLCLGEAEEDDLTARLRSVIENDLRPSGRVNGFSRTTYEWVARQRRSRIMTGLAVRSARPLFQAERRRDRAPNHSV